MIMEYLHYLKYLVYIFPLGIVLAIVQSSIRNKKEGALKQIIDTDPVYIDARVTRIVPGTPTANGIVCVQMDYEFVDEKGRSFGNKNVEATLKTMELYDYNVGASVPVSYCRHDPEKNKLLLPTILSA
ncbi:hypothetical protein ACUY4R_000849 [Kosakonia sp. BK9b]